MTTTDLEQSYFVYENQTVIRLSEDNTELMRREIYTRIQTINKFALILNGLNLVWLMVVCIYLFMMQVGFAFMASGAAHQKNNSSILTNHLVIICSTAMIFLLVSSDLISNSDGGFVGVPYTSSLTIKVQEIEEINEPALKYLSNQLFMYIRCLTCVTIAATQLQERTLVESYLVLSIAISGIIYPMI